MHVHKNTLLKSRFFRAFLTSNFLEAQEKRIVLPEDDFQAVTLFISWLYTGAVTYGESESDNQMRIWKFADKLCDESYCNDLIDAMIAFYERKNYFMGGDYLVPLYKNGLRNSPAAKFGVVTNILVMMTEPSNSKEKTNLLSKMREFGEGLHELTEDLLNEVLAYQTKAAAQRDPKKFKGCQFHEHKDGSTCSKAKAVK